MAKKGSATKIGEGETGEGTATVPAVKERKHRKDGRPHPPDGMRYAKDGSLKPKIPPEMRGYYVVIGVSRRSKAPTIAGRFKSSMKARQFCADYRAMLIDSYSVFSINKMRLFESIYSDQQ